MGPTGKPKTDHPLYWVGKYSSLALTLPASVAAGYLIGDFADHFLHAPILKALGILVGMGGGIYKIFQELSRDERKANRKQ